MASNIIQRTASLAAGTVLENALTGSAFEYARTPTMCSVGVLGGSGLFVTIQAGPTVVLEESPVAVGTAFPVQPDTFYYSFPAAPGDRIVIRIRNSSGGALNWFVVVQMAS